MPTASQRGQRSVLLWIGLAALAAGLAGLGAWSLKPEPARAPTRFSFQAPGLAPHDSSFVWVALRPDGRTVAFAARRDGVSRVYTRALDRLEAQALPGAEGAAAVEAFSADGEWILYSEANARALKKVSVLGGPPVVLGPANTFHADWGTDDLVVQGSESGLLLVSTAGAPAARLTETGSSLTPRVLPNGAVLFGSGDGSSRSIAVVLPGSSETKILLEGSSPVFMEGYLLFYREAALWAAQFDPEVLELRSEPVPVVEGVEGTSSGLANFDARAGNLIYVPRSTTTATLSTLVWVDRQGNEERLPVPEGTYRYPRLSPDGARLGLSSRGFDNEDLFAWDVRDGTRERLTFEAGQDTYSVWLPGGEEFVYTGTTDDGSWELFRRSTSGAGKPVLLGEHAGGARFASSVSPDGEYFLYRVGIYSDLDIEIMPLAEPDNARPLLDSEANELHGAISPDGRWLAYTTDETGRREVYVCSFPDVEKMRKQISFEGGEAALWSPSTDEIFFRQRRDDGPSRMYSVAFEEEEGVFEAGTLQLLFEGEHEFGMTGRNYDVSADGQRFVMIKLGTSEGTEPGEIVVVLNFDEELKRVFGE